MPNKTLDPTLIGEVLGLDRELQRILRNSWPESWLQVNLPVGSTRALFAIEGREARTPGKVAEVLGVSRTTVTGLLDRLENEGLLTRTVDPSDRRCFALQLTPKARDLIAEMEGQRHARIGQALSSITPEELQALHTGLDALVRKIREQ